jgi:hypothetical protein
VVQDIFQISSRHKLKLTMSGSTQEVNNEQEFEDLPNSSLLTDEEIIQLFPDPDAWTDSFEELVNDLGDAVDESVDDDEHELSQASTIVHPDDPTIPVCVRTPLHFDSDDEYESISESEPEREQ